MGRGIGGSYGSLNEGVAAQVLTDSATGTAIRPNLQIVNMLRVPGVQQVALRVKIAELNRTAARNFGVDVNALVNVTENVAGSKLFINSLLNSSNGSTVPILGQFDGDDIKVGLNYLQQQGVVKLLAEPTLVTMSGRPATFVAGGEFAVPTAVGVAGISAVSTDFRAFGSIISFLPTVVDKDRVRLQVSPEFSQVNSDLSVNNVPGLRTRTANTRWKCGKVKRWPSLVYWKKISPPTPQGTCRSSRVCLQTKHGPQRNGTDYFSNAGVGASHGTRRSAATSWLRCHRADQHRVLFKRFVGRESHA